MHDSTSFIIEECLRRITAGFPLCLDLSVEEGLCVRAVVENPGEKRDLERIFRILEGLAVQIHGQGPSERRLGNLGEAHK